MEYKVIGLMSGTSLDGLDLAFCRFSLENGKWSFDIINAETLPYSADWTSRLTKLPNTSAAEFTQTDHDYGHLLGRMARSFMDKYGLSPDFIASHGHTVFHQPEKGFTTQIGNGAAIKAETGLPVICDFRSGDVAHGGQGAPLVPAGDKILFPGYRYCLNLGGFANISFDRNDERFAFDVCPVNIILNNLAGKSGLPFDRDGLMAASGHPDQALLERLNSLSFYSLDGPKSLGREWAEKNIFPILNESALQVNDQLSTYCFHIAEKIASVTAHGGSGEILVTGGGAHNKFLVSLISQKSEIPVIIPDPLTVDFKEALIFAFLGVLRSRNEHNCLSSVTGARKNGSYGCIY